jgi:predicted amidohydrolase YtcJ
MVTRRTDKGTLLGGEQTLTLAEALHAYTWCAAYAEKEEGRKGRLVPGQLADLAVFSADPFDAAPEALLELKADMTILNGGVVHEREGAW